MMSSMDGTMRWFWEGIPPRVLRLEISLGVRRLLLGLVTSSKTVRTDYGKRAVLHYFFLVVSILGRLQLNDDITPTEAICSCLNTYDWKSIELS
mmetsp:Transcript_28853/g.69527  ORF Transcript_28853/g.69527 Transcript_28853/m.69527 type:complete len:94 (-) Transcript_28853:331-612(-)